MYLPLRNLQCNGVARYRTYKVKLESLIIKGTVHEKDIRSSHSLKTETKGLQMSELLLLTSFFIFSTLGSAHLKAFTVPHYRLGLA